MRGKVCHELVHRGAGRITPAHAGKSWSSGSTNRCSSDHPRPCGEKSQWRTNCPWSWGSPPPMRGKGSGYHPAIHTIRITPAHAGKSLFLVIATSFIWDHPRPCGEKRFRRAGCVAGRGSPPPMRGKAAEQAAPGVMYGITPAHAGKSLL